MPTVPGIGSFDASLFGDPRAITLAAQGPSQALQGISQSIQAAASLSLQNRIAKSRMDIEDRRLDLLKKEAETRRALTESTLKINKAKIDQMNLSLERVKEAEKARQAFAQMIRDVPLTDRTNFLKTLVTPPSIRGTPAEDEFNSLLLENFNRVTSAEAADVQLESAKEEKESQKTLRDLDIEEKIISNETKQLRNELIRKEIDRGGDISQANEETARSVLEAVEDTPEVRRAVQSVVDQANLAGKPVDFNELLGVATTSSALTDRRVKEEASTLFREITSKIRSGGEDTDELVDSLDFSSGTITFTDDFLETVRGFDPESASESVAANRELRRVVKQFENTIADVDVSDDTKRKVEKELFGPLLAEVAKKTTVLDESGLPDPGKVRAILTVISGNGVSRKDLGELDVKEVERLREKHKNDPTVVVQTFSKPRDVSFLRKRMEKLGIRVNAGKKSRAEEDIRLKAGPETSPR